MKAWFAPLLLSLLIVLPGHAEEGVGLLLEEEGEESLTPEELERQALKRLIRERRFDYIFRGIDTPGLAERTITVNGRPLDEATLAHQPLVPLYRVAVRGTTLNGAPYTLPNTYLFDACRRGAEAPHRWLGRYPVYRCRIGG